MDQPEDCAIRATGGCLCGAVRFEVRGRLLDIINCHCSKCRRFNGNVGAYTATLRENLVIVKAEALKWYRSTQDETPNVYRGFCGECGSSLFWDPRNKPNICLAAGAIDPPTELKTGGHVWISQKGDYYEIADDLPQYEQGYDRPELQND